MLYSFLKCIVRIAMFIFCRKITINHPSLLHKNGPLLIASNHPNSFLDAVILDVLFKQPIWSLARGDVFKKKWIARLLHAVRILPVYRTSEGVENLTSNYSTFNECIRIFRNNGCVQIFSEGKCVNEWHLRPLKKGTARLALQAWKEKIPLQVLPVGINYSSFRRFGKNIFINIGTPITSNDLDLHDSDGNQHIAFNKILASQLQSLVMEIPVDDFIQQQNKLQIIISPVIEILLAPFALTGWILHAPLYLTVKYLVKQKMGESDHYDSIITGLLVLLYVPYLLVIFIVLFILTGSWICMLLFVIAPFCARALMLIKKQF